jgi:hypothetical protein
MSPRCNREVNLTYLSALLSFVLRSPAHPRYGNNREINVYGQIVCHPHTPNSKALPEPWIIII